MITHVVRSVPWVNNIHLGDPPARAALASTRSGAGDRGVLDRSVIASPTLPGPITAPLSANYSRPVSTVVPVPLLGFQQHTYRHVLVHY
jgi:hypothetical protein